ncbi:unnamed protein product [Kuraishia capsulata CBS 1993]|uniref:Nuclear control of ATPase protein 2 n=1 Tax=Kuraishia capsulata CBS 1993 TaxID=1382522 RepID=W6MXT7_9ASCO|nr:uncharacterized protein KUCA_T00005443001 [Kuraishia capsulata CBS 1993]CDK29455.1 unnamed protein product [Kuraishia capsulata CBS 1993]
MSVITDAVRANLEALDVYSSSALREINELKLVNDTEIRGSVGSDVLGSIDQIQAVFAECYMILEPLRKTSNGHYGQKEKRASYASGVEDVEDVIKSVTGKKLGQLLAPFAQGPILASSAISSQNYSEEIKKELRTMSKLEGLSLLYSLLSLYLYTGQLLLKNTIPLSDELAYWESVLNSRLYMLLYVVQTLPVRGYEFSKALYNDVVVKNIETGTRATLPTPPEWVPEKLRPFYSHAYKWLRFTLQSIYSSSRSIMSTRVFFNNLKSRPIVSTIGISPRKASIFTNNVFVTILGAPVIAAKREAIHRRENILNLKSANAEKLGVLLSELLTIRPADEDDDSDPYEFLEKTGVLTKAFEAISKFELLFQGETSAVGMYSGTGSDSIQSSLVKLQNLFSKLLPSQQKQIRATRSKNSRPRAIIRYWVSTALIVLYAPALIKNVVSEWDELVLFFKHNVVGTLVGFWNNWIISPLNNIFATVRHDDNSRIAIMSKQSLESDLSSLERMVTDYSLANISLAGQELDPRLALATVQENVKNGDITIVMRKYEQDLKSPVKSIIMGDMLTNLLIQIQKAKVDGTVAISGIDKILKSQELVFGVVAASPSLLVVYWVLRSVESYIRTGYVYRFSRDRKLLVLQSLNNIERLLNLALHDDAINFENSGMLLLELITLRENGQVLVPKDRRWEFVRDVNDLTSKDFTTNVKLVTITRMWNNYGSYFRD